MHLTVRAIRYVLSLYMIIVCFCYLQSDALPLSFSWRGTKANILRRQRQEEGVAPNSPLSELSPPSIRNDVHNNEDLIADFEGDQKNQGQSDSEGGIAMKPDPYLDPSATSNVTNIIVNYSATVSITTRNDSASSQNATDEDTLHTMKMIQLAGASHRRKLASTDGEEGENGNDADSENSGGDENGHDGQYDGSTDNNGENSDSSDDSNSNYENGGENGSESGSESGGNETDNHDSDQPSFSTDRETISATSPEFAHTVRTAAGVDGTGIDSRHAHTNLTHLSSMLLKIIKTYNVKSVADIPCRNSLQFFPKLLPTLDFEVMGFKYYCVDSEKDSHEDIAHYFGDAGNPEILHIKPTETSMLPKTDLVFSWDGPQDWGVTKTWTFFANLRIIRPKYLLITNNPTELNADKPGVLNLRKQPFHFAQANRVIAKVHASENPALGLPKKQLLFYQIDDIRRGF